MTRLVLGWMVSLLVTLGAVPLAAAADDEKTWEFSVAAPYLWLPEEHGHIGIGPVSVPVDVDFGDIFTLMGNASRFGRTGCPSPT